MSARPRHKSRHRGIYYRNGSDDPNAKGERRWIVWYADSDGRGHYETQPVGATEKDALARQAELRGKVSKGERVAPSRVTLEDFANDWLASQEGRLKPKTVSIYRYGLKQHVYPALKRRRVSEVTVDDVARLIDDMRKAGKAPGTIRSALTPLSRVMAHAVRRGVAGTNPVRGLEKHERPKGSERKLRILDSDEIGKLLEKVPRSYRTLIATAIFTGMRKGELLGLRWADVDFDAGHIVIREGKTNAAAREIVLMPGLGKRLREHKLASGYSDPQDLVFCSKLGTPLGTRNVTRRGLEKGLSEAGLDHARFHDLRHTFASMLIGQGLDVTFVSNQLGHADPAVTLKVYAKLFDPQKRRAEARGKLEAAFGAMV